MTYKENINKFLIAIDNLIHSKYLFVEKNISDVLHSVADTDEVYNLIAKCMINFDFVEQWQIATNGNKLEFPEDSSNKIAFIFCLLNNIDDKNLDIDKLLERYFSYNPDEKPFEIFCYEVAGEFKNLIISQLNISESFEDTNEEDLEEEDLEDEETESVEQSDEESDLIEETEQEEIENEDSEDETEQSEAYIKQDMETLLEYVLKLKNEIRAMKKLKRSLLSKSDLIAVVSTLEYAIKTNSLEYFYALVLSIKCLTSHLKNLKSLTEKIEEISNKLIRS